MSIFTNKGTKPTESVSSRDYEGDSSRCTSTSVKLDSKGRISIPNFLRKNFNLKEGVEVRLVFDLSKNFFIVQNGVKKVEADTESLDKRLLRPLNDSIEVCETSSVGSTPASGPQFKKIGVLGGMGPESTALFYQKIIKEYQRSGAIYDSDYPEIFIYNLPIPDVVNGFNNSQIANLLVQGCKKVESMGADFIVVPCNTVSYFINCMRKSVSIPIYSIIEETARNSYNYKKLGLLATKTTVKNKLYENVFEKYGIEIVNTESLEDVNRIILNVLSGKLLKKDRNRLVKITNSLVDNGSEAIILGCTDIPLLLKQKDVDIKLIDALSVYADFTAKYSRRCDI